MNKVQHFEIPADDISRAYKFYKDVFGWKEEEYPRGNGVYHLFNSGIAKNEAEKSLVTKIVADQLLGAGEARYIANRRQDRHAGVEANAWQLH